MGGRMQKAGAELGQFGTPAPPAVWPRAGQGLGGLSVLVCNEGLDPSVYLAFHVNVAFHESISTSSPDLEQSKRQKRGAPGWLSG